MEITFDLRHWFQPNTSLADNAYALRALLDCLISINESYLRNHTVRPLYQSGVVYGRTQIWDPIPALYKRRYGDCKSVSAALIAQLRKEGTACDPAFRFHERTERGVVIRDFHILVETAKGFTDPSKVLGMGKDEFSPMPTFSDPPQLGLDLTSSPRVGAWLSKLGLG